MPLIGSTVTLKAKFASERGTLYDVTDVKLTLYNDRKKIIREVSEEEMINLDIGTYVYNYIVPSGVGQIYYEFEGMLEGVKIIGRRVITREWIKRGGCDVCDD